MLEIEQEEEARIHSGETADRKMLRRDIEKAAIARLEDAAETEADFWEVVSQWDRLDKNRERKERYHEVGRAEVPLEYGASVDQVHPLWRCPFRQIRHRHFHSSIRP